MARAAALDTERQALIDQLKAATGLGGRSRRLGDNAERARKSVTNRIRNTLKKIEAVHPALAAHLDGAVATGSACVYRPGPPPESSAATRTRSLRPGTSIPCDANAPLWPNCAETRRSRAGGDPPGPAGCFE